MDFLDATVPLAERELEDALTGRLEDFAIDLLFFTFAASRFVVVEAKVGRFAPAHVGQLGFYVAWVDENLRTQAHAATVGILVCTTRGENVVRYSLAGAPAPMAVSTYTYDSLPRGVREVLPTDAELGAATADLLDAGDRDADAGQVDEAGESPS